MDDRIIVEQRFLNNTQELIQDLLDEYFNSGKSDLDAFSKHRTKDLVRRIINQEVEYLREDPDNYFDIYGQDFKGN